MVKRLCRTTHCADAIEMGELDESFSSGNFDVSKGLSQDGKQTQEEKESEVSCLHGLRTKFDEWFSCFQ